jgi:DNA-directed RNA polymerase specialized sigma24 family protein
MTPRPKDQRLTDEERQEILLRYDLGLSTEQLAERFGVHPETIRRLLPVRRQRGPRLGPSVRRSDVRDDVVVRLRDVDGLSWAQLGAAVGMTWSGARNRYWRAKRRITTPT